MPTPPRRRWFQFGLRTMFVVVTIFAVWLGWELKAVRERKAAREWLRETREGAVPEFATGMAFNIHDDVRIPFWRVWLGDEAAPAVLFRERLPKEHKDRIGKLFPEAEIIVVE